MNLDDWPVLPEGIEGVLLFSMPAGSVSPAEDCFVCGERVPAGGMCFGVPGRGVAHDYCYQPEDADA